MHYRDEKTLIIIKPDGAQRSLIGETIKRLERTGLKLVALDFRVLTKKEVEGHYTIDSDWLEKTGKKSIENSPNPDNQNFVEVGQKILDRLVKYMTSGPVVMMVWQGAHAVSVVRKIVGGTEPKTSDIGTIRGDFVIDSYEMSDSDNRSVRNLVHASGSVEDAEKEVGYWFSPEKIIKYRLVQEQILYDVNLDGILE